MEKDLINKIIAIFDRNKNVNSIFIKPKEGYLKEFVENNKNLIDAQVQYEQLNELLFYYKTFKNQANPFDIKGEENISFTEIADIQSFSYLINKKINEKDFSFFPLWKVVYLKILMLLVQCLSFYEFEYSDENINKVLSNIKSNALCYYRGLSSYDYSLVPSMYRDLKFCGFVDRTKIRELYSSSGLLKKYESIFGITTSLDYRTCAFFQHATSYSPFLDFTKDCNVALIFATQSCGNINLYNRTNAALVLLSLTTESATDIDLKDINVEYLSKKLEINTLIYDTPLYLCSVSNFKPVISFSRNATNDRMMYQKGVFLCFNRCVIVKNRPLFPFSYGYFVKFKIHAENDVKKPKGTPNKKEIYNSTVKKVEYLQENYLMNPYLFFSQYAKNIK